MIYFPLILTWDDIFSRKTPLEVVESERRDEEKVVQDKMR